MITNRLLILPTTQFNMIEPNMWIDRFFIRERIDDGTLCLGFVTSEEQIADCLTKGLSVRGCESSCDKMGMIDVYGPS